MRSALLLGLLALGNPDVGGPKRSTYVLDPNASDLFVVVRKDTQTALSTLGHDHVIRAGQLSGTVDFDPSAPKECKIDIIVPVAGLKADEPQMRKKVGLEGQMSEGNRADIEKDMRAEDQLDAARFPNITFKGTGCEAGAKDTVNVKGEITIHGKSMPVQVAMQYRFEGATLHARGRFNAKHADFGMKPYSAALGSLKNGEALNFGLDVKADPQPKT
jgi:polyisoprenoid-binding protein YceI